MKSCKLDFSQIVCCHWNVSTACNLEYSHQHKTSSLNYTWSLKSFDANTNRKVENILQITNRDFNQIYKTIYCNKLLKLETKIDKYKTFFLIIFLYKVLTSTFIKSLTAVSRSFFTKAASQHPLHQALRFYL